MLSDMQQEYVTDSQELWLHENMINAELLQQDDLLSSVSAIATKEKLAENPLEKKLKEILTHCRRYNMLAPTWYDDPNYSEKSSERQKLISIIDAGCQEIAGFFATASKDDINTVLRSSSRKDFLLSGSTVPSFRSYPSSWDVDFMLKNNVIAFLYRDVWSKKSPSLQPVVSSLVSNGAILHASTINYDANKKLDPIQPITSIDNKARFMIEKEWVTAIQNTMQDLERFFVWWRSTPDIFENNAYVPSIFRCIEDFDGYPILDTREVNAEDFYTDYSFDKNNKNSIGNVSVMQYRSWPEDAPHILEIAYTLVCDKIDMLKPTTSVFPPKDPGTPLSWPFQIPMIATVVMQDIAGKPNYSTMKIRKVKAAVDTGFKLAPKGFVPENTAISVVANNQLIAWEWKTNNQVTIQEKKSERPDDSWITKRSNKIKEIDSLERFDDFVIQFVQDLSIITPESDQMALLCTVLSQKDKEIQSQGWIQERVKKQIQTQGFATTLWWSYMIQNL